MVTITPRGIPDGASIILDDTLLPAEPFTLPKGEDPVTFRVEAAGYEPAEFEVTPDEDQQVRIVLEKRAQAKTHPSGGNDDGTGDGDSSKKKPRKKIKNPFRKLARELKK